MHDPIEQALPPELQGHIGEHLRAAYNQLVQEPIPDDIRELLARLQATEDGRADKGSKS